MRRKPNWVDCEGEFWYDSVVDFVSVKTEELMEGCQEILKECGYFPYKSVQVFVKLIGFYNLYSYDGKEWENLGYLDNNPKTDVEFKRFIASLLNDLCEDANVIVLPSLLEGYSFFKDYPACYRSCSGFARAWENRTGRSLEVLI